MTQTYMINFFFWRFPQTWQSGNKKRAGIEIQPRYKIQYPMKNHSLNEWLDYLIVRIGK